MNASELLEDLEDMFVILIKLATVSFMHVVPWNIALNIFWLQVVLVVVSVS